MASVNGGGVYKLSLFSVTVAAPNANVVVTLLPIGNDLGQLNSSPDARQVGTVHLIPTGDPRVLDAAWYRDRLWLSLNHACSPPGDTETRACIRLIQVATSPSPASI